MKNEDVIIDGEWGEVKNPVNYGTPDYNFYDDASGYWSKHDPDYDVTFAPKEYDDEGFDLRGFLNKLFGVLAVICIGIVFFAMFNIIERMFL